MDKLVYAGLILGLSTYLKPNSVCIAITVGYMANLKYYTNKFIEHLGCSHYNEHGWNILV